MAESVTNEEIRAIALANGFSLREQPDGSMDLNPYVYEFARALRAEVMSEIRPLVADLSAVVIADQRTISDLISGSYVIPDAEKIERSIAAIERLRDLVREGE